MAGMQRAVAINRSKQSRLFELAQHAQQAENIQRMLQGCSLEKLEVELATARHSQPAAPAIVLLLVVLPDISPLGR